MKLRNLYTIAIVITICLAVNSPGKDLNNDSCIDILDSKRFLELVTSGGISEQALDLNRDSKVDISDALLYGQWVNGLYHSATCPDLFLNNPADTAAFSNYAKSVIANKKTITSSALTTQYSFNAIQKKYVASDVEGLENLSFMLKMQGVIDTQVTSAFTDSVLSKGVSVFTPKTFPNFMTALDAIHTADMPLLFTTDALLYSMYRSYDDILKTLETNHLYGLLENILSSSLEYCNHNYGSSECENDARDYLSTALFLLVPGRSDIVKNTTVSSFLSSIQSESMTKISIFGGNSLVDFSQFKPRGHYEGYTQLENYFKAMMWLSRADLAIPISGKETSKRMKKAALVLWDCVVNSGAYAKWLEFNSAIEFMVGTSDGLSIKGIGALVQDLGISDVKNYLNTFDELKFDSVVNKNNYGIQLILSQGKYYDRPQDSLDLAKVVSFMPQRFILDSYTFSQLVFPLTTEHRELPSSIDIAFVLGDNSALINYSGLSVGGVPGILYSQRKLYDQISHSGYMANLYTSWLYSLRQLNGAETNSKVSPVFRTSAWRMKMRNTQLMSWAHLRHNTILYSKQSYTGIAVCSYPKVYVEPYPAFFQAVTDYASKGKAFFKTYNKSVADYFEIVEQISGKLRKAADFTASGRPISAVLETWMKGCITSSTESRGCTTVKVFDGWYMDLFFSNNPSSEGASYFPSIADVHTKPFDDMGPAKVLHAASGLVNLMAVVVEADSCPMVFVGPVGSYYDVITEHPSTPQRLANDAWKTKISTTARPQWMSQVLFQ